MQKYSMYIIKECAMNEFSIYQILYYKNILII